MARTSQGRARVLAASCPAPRLAPRRATDYASCMRWALFAAVLLLSIAGFALGAWLGGKSKRVATATVAVGLLALFARTATRYLPHLEYHLLPFDWYAVVHPWWVIPAAFLTLGVGTRQMSTPNGRRLVGVFAGALLLVCVQRLWITARFDPATVHGRLNREGLCIQSTDYSCGAASAVMLLHQAGVASTEREMAELCWTNGLTGTDEFGVCMGLRRKLAGSGRRPALVRSDWDDLVRRRGPAMATIYFGFMIDHWVLVLEAREHEVVLLDPLAGRRVLTRDEFLAVWRRGLVVIDAG